MAPRAAWSGLAFLAVAAAILFLALRRDDPEQPSRDESRAPAPDRPPGVMLSGVAPQAPSPQGRPEPASASDGLPVDGIVMGPDRLHGIVVDPDGAPIADARVYLRTKDGQPTALDAPWLWNARTDPDGRWAIADTWASRSLLCAWAPGYERAAVEVLTPDAECRVVLEPSSAVMVTVRSPAPPAPPARFHADVSQVRLRVRLVAEGAREHPRPAEALAAEWEQEAEPDVPTLVRIPRGARAHVTADARRFACEPVFVAVPVERGGVVLELVPSATILVRLLDAATRAPLRLELDGPAFVSVTSTRSGFALKGVWRDEAQRLDRGVALGSYEVTVRYRGFLPMRAPASVEVTKRDRMAEVDVLLERDPECAVVHLVPRHAEGSHESGTPLEPGVTLVRRREDAPAAWKQAGGVSGRSKRTLTDLRPGTYDFLVWNGGRFPAVGALVGLEVKGGTETTHEVELKGGYGFRPTDVLDGSPDTMHRVRARCDLLGALPWIDNFEGPEVHAADPEGFTATTLRGYIGPYPSPTLRIVEQPKEGSPREHTVRASIGPPR